MRTRVTPPTTRPPLRRAARGFTLVELMVALSGGLFLSVVIFALARDATRFYQQEARLAGATLSGMVGFERLKNDIQRAGYLSTPNIQKDLTVCTSVSSTTPTALRSLAALRITPDTPDLLSTNAAFQANQAAGQVITPDQIVLSGSYDATDEFPIAEASTGSTIYLQVNSAPMARLGYYPSTSNNAKLALLQNVFGAAKGQILRVKDQTGMLYFGEIASVTAGSQPYITLSSAFPVKWSGAGLCGLRGFEVGSSANVVNIVRYSVMDLQHSAAGTTTWKPLFDASADEPGHDTRTELVREGLAADGTVIAGTTDLVAEYAVDLGFAVTGQATVGSALTTEVASDSSGFKAFFAPGATNDRPQGVRSVRVRLSVRSRDADRTAAIAGGLYRFKLDTDQWARVRTFQADVPLPNQANVYSW